MTRVLHKFQTHSQGSSFPATTLEEFFNSIRIVAISSHVAPRIQQPALPYTLQEELPTIPSPASPFPTVRTIPIEVQVSLLVLCHFSWKQNQAWVQQQQANIQHFQREFHVQLSAFESIVWHSLRAVNIFSIFAGGALVPGLESNAAAANIDLVCIFSRLTASRGKGRVLLLMRCIDSSCVVRN
jgi:hypothetical protein